VFFFFFLNEKEAVFEDLLYLNQSQASFILFSFIHDAQ